MVNRLWYIYYTCCSIYIHAVVYNINIVVFIMLHKEYNFDTDTSLQLSTIIRTTLGSMVSLLIIALAIIVIVFYEIVGKKRKKNM